MDEEARFGCILYYVPPIIVHDHRRGDPPTLDIVADPKEIRCVDSNDDRLFEVHQRAQGVVIERLTMQRLKWQSRALAQGQQDMAVSIDRRIHAESVGGLTSRNPARGCCTIR